MKQKYHRLKSESKAILDRWRRRGTPHRRACQPIFRQSRRLRGAIVEVGPRRRSRERREANQGWPSGRGSSERCRRASLALRPLIHLPMRRWKGLARSRTAVLPRRIGSSASDGLGLGLGLGWAGSGGSAGVGDSE